jgi:hypothetical protein
MHGRCLLATFQVSLSDSLNPLNLSLPSGTSSAARSIINQSKSSNICSNMHDEHEFLVVDKPEPTHTYSTKTKLVASFAGAH